MSDIQEQLAELRKRIARIDERYAARAGSGPSWSTGTLTHVVQGNAPSDRRPARYFVEEYLSGSEVRTAAGAHFESERLWERTRNHGSFELSALDELGPNLLEAISNGAITNCACDKWAFLDTETTGLAGGAGTYAFLIGVGRIIPEGFHLRQFFMREPCEEPSLLSSLSDYLAQFDVLVTYNGRTYDQPLLETRYRLARAASPFDRLQHLDLLFGARRLWNLRFESCRLVELENQILGFEREGDLPGSLIPYVYFEYLRSREAGRVAPILHHNAHDILTLACLTAIVPRVYQSPDDVTFGHGAEMVGISRWLRKAERLEQACQMLKRAIDHGLSDELLFRSLWDLAQMQRKLEDEEGYLATLSELSTCRNPHQVDALEELAKHYEHRAANPAQAMAFTMQALDLESSPELSRRLERLERKLKKEAATRRTRRLL